MALSKIVKKECPECHKPFIQVGRIDFGTSVLLSGQCGHLIPEDKLISQGDDYERLLVTEKDHKPFRPYQVDGVKFIEQANARVLVADEQGLGKTWQATGFLKLHKEKLPAVIATKASVTQQWFWEIDRICGREGFLTQVIRSGKERCLPGFDIYIMSWDMLKVEGMFDMLDEHPKTLILDEVQAIKNHLSGRAKAAQDVSKNFEHIIALSGTPIKNNAGEYFTILNILKPERFPEYNAFVRDYCDHYETMYGYKVGGLADSTDFLEDTKDFIIRRTRKEAAPEIPEVDRQFFHVDFNKKLKGAYDDLMKELEKIYYQDESEESMTSIIAVMTKMRRLTGINKVAHCLDYLTQEFFPNEPDRKIVVGLHHHDVVTLLEADLNKWLLDPKEHPNVEYSKALNFHSGLTAEQRYQMVEQFKNDSRSRIMLASTLAAGEGINLQFCSRAIMLERQWNPANEEQFEGRFARIGQEDNIVVLYMIATETIDEYFTELVEQKRAIVANTLDNKHIEWDSNSLMKELASVLITKGNKKFTLQGVK
jgi:SNF2 family DNA or RNA helicase